MDADALVLKGEPMDMMLTFLSGVFQGREEVEKIAGKIILVENLALIDECQTNRL